MEQNLVAGFYLFPVVVVGGRGALPDGAEQGDTGHRAEIRHRIVLAVAARCIRLVVAVILAGRVRRAVANQAVQVADRH